MRGYPSCGGETKYPNFWRRTNVQWTTYSAIPDCRRIEPWRSRSTRSSGDCADTCTRSTGSGAAALAPTETNYTWAQVLRGQVSDTAKTRSPLVSDYLARESRRGRNLDMKALNAAQVGDTSVVWADGSRVDRIGVVQTPDTTGVGLITSEVQEDQTPAGAAAPGMGMSTFSQYAGGTYQSGNCVSSSTYGDTVTSCFEKYKINNTSSNRYRWAYNRWGTGDPNGSGHRISEITIRSRPWAGTAGNVAALNDYYPRGGGDICPGSGTSVSVGYAGFSATMPLQNCAITDVSPNATAKSMMSQWIGAYTGTSKSTDFNMFLSTFQPADLVMADYIWGNFSRYPGPPPYVYSASWHDSGW